MPWAAQRQKRTRVIRSVFAVQFIDQMGQMVDQNDIVRCRFRLRVSQIGEQAESQSFIPVGEIMDFQCTAQVFDLFYTDQHGRYDDKRVVSFGNAF